MTTFTTTQLKALHAEMLSRMIALTDNPTHLAAASMRVWLTFHRRQARDQVRALTAELEEKLQQDAAGSHGFPADEDYRAWKKRRMFQKAQFRELATTFSGAEKQVAHLEQALHKQDLERAKAHERELKFDTIFAQALAFNHEAKRLLPREMVARINKEVKAGLPAKAAEQLVTEVGMVRKRQDMLDKEISELKTAVTELLWRCIPFVNAAEPAERGGDPVPVGASQYRELRQAVLAIKDRHWTIITPHQPSN